MHDDSPPVAPPVDTAHPRRGSRLDSWKEIAAYLQRDIRTVQRWEKQEGLPVHRHQHDERGTAYAYAEEIDRWLAGRSRASGSAGLAAPATLPVDDQELSGPAQHGQVRSVRASTSRHRLAWMTGFAAVGLVIALATWWISGTIQPRGPALSALSVVLPVSDILPEWGPDTALSPDGSTLVYTASGGPNAIRVRRLNDLESRALEGTAGTVWGPFFSPDGQWVGFSQEGKLMRIALAGGAPIPIADMDTDFVGAADWGADNFIVFAARTPEQSHGLFRVHAWGGQPQQIATLDEPETAGFWLTPQSIRGGEAVLCTISRSSTAGTRFQLAVVSVATGEHRVLVENARHGLYLGEGILVFQRDGSLFAIQFDPARLQTRGPEVAVWRNLGQRVRLRSWTYAGDILVAWPGAPIEHQLVWIDRDGGEEPLPMPAADYTSPRLSPDGRSIAFITGGEFGNAWTRELATGAMVQLSSGGRTDKLTWTPDGLGLILSMQEGGWSQLYHVRADGSGPSTRLELPPGPLRAAYKEPLSWTGDGRWLLFRQAGAKDLPSLWRHDPVGGGAPHPAIQAGGIQADARISPDGRWIAYTTAESAMREVYVARFPEGRPRWRLSSDGGGRGVVWARDGRSLFYRTGDLVMEVPVKAGDGFMAGAPLVRFKAPILSAGPGAPQYDISLDGRRLLIVRRAPPRGPSRLDVVQGWKSEVARRLRAD